MNNLKLRKATTEDSEFAYQTRKSAFREYVDKVGGWDENEQRQLHTRRFATLDFYVMQVSSKNVGILAMARQTDCITVYQMFIPPEYQSKGIGAECIDLIIKEAAVSKLPIRLQVLKVNDRAAAFYQRLGFVKTGENYAHILMERIV